MIDTDFIRGIVPDFEDHKRDDRILNPAHIAQKLCDAAQSNPELPGPMNWILRTVERTMVKKQPKPVIDFIFDFASPQRLSGPSCLAFDCRPPPGASVNAIPCLLGGIFKDDQ